MQPGTSTGWCRSPAFDQEIHKRRNVVERCFDRLGQWRGIATRYDCEDVQVPLRAVV